MSLASERVDTVALQRRTVRSLVATQAVGALGITIALATASLLARDLSGSDSLAGLAQTSQVLGAAVASWTLASVMATRGRRVGLLAGICFATVGSLLCVVAGAVGSMPLLLLGTFLVGSMTAANSSARYAATDLADPETRARDLSLVVWATTVGAVLGPNLAEPSAALADRLGLPPLTGPFLVGAVGMAVAAVVVAVRLRPDPLVVARQVAGESVPRRPGPGGVMVGALAVMRDEPLVACAMAAVAAAHAVMVGVMVMTPLHMQHGGAHLHVIGLVISVHVLGMFAFAPVVGWLTDRMGRPRMIVLGGAVLLVAVTLAGLSPQGSSWQVFAGLFVLGIGWSFVTIAGSTLLTDRTPLAARTDVQGASDLVMGLSAGVAGGLSGVVVGALGYGWLNALAAALGAVVLGVGVVAGRSGSRP
ncbi:MFS transporter [Nocardioides jiangxiensis]|uniref:MFS transporter n=1 Tax=Nocardioides jiangxiensis TaxID=3064524 RepID=A0ABT9AWV9_9ACTN|nr:MFS transporter [Nocardioides sp. WY-20]MDO7866981.1 MFS transporter [Nocardioides sp. WY-20]